MKKIQMLISVGVSLVLTACGGSSPSNQGVNSSRLSPSQIPVVNVNKLPIPLPGPKPAENQPPVAEAGPETSVQVGASIVLTGSGTDTDGTIVGYRWRLGSTQLADTASFTFSPTAPGTVLLVLEVTDDDGATASDAVVVHIRPSDNRPPVADAGADQQVELGKSVELIGRGSDADGSVTGFSWKQGNTELSTDASFTYTPSELGKVTLVLEVTDNQGASSQDAVEINVVAAPSSAGGEFQVHNLVNNGHPEETYTLVIMAEGFEASQKRQFLSAARTVVTQMKGHTTFAPLMDKVNVAAIHTVFQASGDVKSAQAPDTFFALGDSALADEIELDQSMILKASRVSAEHLPFADLTLVLANGVAGDNVLRFPGSDERVLVAGMSRSAASFLSTLATGITGLSRSQCAFDTDGSLQSVCGAQLSAAMGNKQNKQPQVNEIELANAAPQAVNLKSMHSGAVRIQWNSVAQNSASQIRLTNSQGSYSEFMSDQTSVELHNLKVGEQYKVKIRSFTQQQNSAFSPELLLIRPE